MQSERRMGRTRQKNKNETLIIKSHEIWVSVNIYTYICIHIFEYKQTFFQIHFILQSNDRSLNICCQVKEMKLQFILLILVQ